MASTSYDPLRTDEPPTRQDSNSSDHVEVEIGAADRRRRSGSASRERPPMNPGNQQVKEIGRASWTSIAPPWLLITVWIAISSAVIVYNKHILSTLDFPYPVTLTSLHLVFQSIATRLLHRYTNLITTPPGKSSPSSNASAPSQPSAGSSLPPPVQSPQRSHAISPPVTEHPLDVKEDPLLRNNGDGSGSGSGAGVGAPNATPSSTDAGLSGAPSGTKPALYIDSETYWRKVMPICALFSMSLLLSNYAYLYLSVAYIHMLKSFSPVAVTLISFALGLKQPTIKLLLIVFTISCGVALASYAEAEFSWIGFIIQCCAVVVEASRVTSIQLLLHSAGLNPLSSQYFFSPPCLLMNTLLILPLEGTAGVSSLWRLGPFVILTNAGLAFSLNVSATYLIGLSSLILSLSKVVKDIILIAGSLILFGGTISFLQGVGYAVALGGLIWYKFN